MARVQRDARYIGPDPPQRKCELRGQRNLLFISFFFLIYASRRALGFFERSSAHLALFSSRVFARGLRHMHIASGFSRAARSQKMYREHAESCCCCVYRRPTISLPLDRCACPRPTFKKFPHPLVCCVCIGIYKRISRAFYGLV